MTGVAARPDDSPVRHVVGVARHELRALGGSAWVLLGLTLSGLYLYRLLEGYPVVLGRDSIYIGNALAPLALGGFLACHSLSSRSRRYRADDLVASLPVSPQQRLGSELLAGTSVALLAAAFAGGAVLWADVTGATGGPAAGELVAGVAVVWLASVAGSAIGHRFGDVWSIIVPILIVVGVAVFLTGDATRRRWLGPFVDFPTRLDVVDVARRVPWTHAAYLASIAGLLIVLGVTRSRTRAAATVALGLAVIVLAWVQLRPASDRDQASAAELATTFDRHSCEENDGVTICLLPGYDGWRAEIATGVERVRRRLPAHPPTPVVLAQVVDRLPPDAYPTGFTRRIDAAIADQLPERVPLRKDQPLDSSTLTAIGAWLFGLPVAPGAAFLPPTSTGDVGRAPDLYCSDTGPRPVVAAVAAVADTPYADEVADQAAAAVTADESAVSLLHVGAVELTAEQAQLLAAILGDDQATDALLDNLDVLPDPIADLAELRTVTGLSAPSPIPRYPDWIATPPPCV